MFVEPKLGENSVQAGSGSFRHRGIVKQALDALAVKR
jgi:hypothetical protein